MSEKSPIDGPIFKAAVFLSGDDPILRLKARLFPPEVTMAAGIHAGLLLAVHHPEWAMAALATLPEAARGPEGVRGVTEACPLAMVDGEL